MRKYLFRIKKYELHYIECEDKNEEDAIDVLLQTNENDSKIEITYEIRDKKNKTVNA